MSNEKRKQQSNEALMVWLRKQENGEEAWAGNVWSAAVEWADSHPQWIPVEEELPKCNIVDCGLATYPVLVYREDGFIDISCYDSEVGEWDCVGVVTHWMPLPTPPQGKEE